MQITITTKASPLFPPLTSCRNPLKKKASDADLGRRQRSRARFRGIRGGGDANGGRLRGRVRIPVVFGGAGSNPCLLWPLRMSSPGDELHGGQAELWYGGGAGEGGGFQGVKKAYIRM